MSDEILERFKTRLAKKKDISPRTRNVLSGSENSSNFGKDEELLAELLRDDQS